MRHKLLVVLVFAIVDEKLLKWYSIFNHLQKFSLLLGSSFFRDQSRSSTFQQ